MRCVACNIMLKEFDDFKYCTTCITASKDNYTEFKDKQFCDLTNKPVQSDKNYRNKQDY